MCRRVLTRILAKQIHKGLGSAVLLGGWGPTTGSILVGSPGPPAQGQPSTAKSLHGKGSLFLKHKIRKKITPN